MTKSVKFVSTGLYLTARLNQPFFSLAHHRHHTRGRVGRLELSSNMRSVYFFVPNLIGKFEIYNVPLSVVNIFTTPSNHNGEVNNVAN